MVLILSTTMTMPHEKYKGRKATARAKMEEVRQLRTEGVGASMIASQRRYQQGKCVSDVGITNSEVTMFNFRKRKRLREEKKTIRIKTITDKIVAIYLPMKYENIKSKLDNDGDFCDSHYFSDFLQFQTHDYDVLLVFEITVNDKTNENELEVFDWMEYAKTHSS